MVQITEFRIVMPMMLDEYEPAMFYTVTKMEQQNTTNAEGVEILKHSTFEDEILGKGQYTLKLYHFLSKVPAWLKALAPADAFVIHEESWNAYPRSKTVIKCPRFGKFHVTIDTFCKADNGCSENVHGLSNELLATRKVEILDIASSTRNYWSKVIGTTRVDLSKYKSQRTGRGPLLKGWKERCDPVMTAYKLVTVEAQYWGFGYRVEQTMLAGERALFLETHRRCFALIDEWFGMTMEDIPMLEIQNGLVPDKISSTTLRSHMEEQGEQNQHGKDAVKQQILKHPMIDDGINRGLRTGTHLCTKFQIERRWCTTNITNNQCNQHISSIHDI